MEIAIITVVSFFAAIMSFFLSNLYMEDSNIIKNKKKIAICLSIFVILNIFCMFYGKNIILPHLLLLFTLLSLTYLYKKYITQNKILETYCYGFVMVFSICFYGILIFAKIYYKSSFLWVLEFCLLYIFVTHCMLFLKYNKKMNRRNNRDIKVVAFMSLVIYFFIAFVINRNYIQLKIIFLIFLSIGVTIILIDKKSEIFDSFVGAFLIVIYILVANQVYLKNIEINEISRISQIIKINDDLNDLINYDINERFLFFEKEDFDKKENLNIYIVKEKEGKKVLEKDETITSYKVYDAVDKMYLEEITITNEKINNNLATKEKSIQKEKIYKLYYYK